MFTTFAHRYRFITFSILLIYIAATSCSKEYENDLGFEDFANVFGKKNELKFTKNGTSIDLSKFVDWKKIYRFALDGQEYVILDFQTNRTVVNNEIVACRYIIVKLSVADHYDFEFLELFTKKNIPNIQKINLAASIFKVMKGFQTEVSFVSPGAKAILYDKHYVYTTSLYFLNQDNPERNRIQVKTGLQVT